MLNEVSITKDFASESDAPLAISAQGMSMDSTHSASLLSNSAWAKLLRIIPRRKVYHREIMLQSELLTKLSKQDNLISDTFLLYINLFNYLF